MDVGYVGPFQGFMVGWIGGGIAVDEAEAAGAVVWGRDPTDRTAHPPDVVRGVIHGQGRLEVYGVDWLRVSAPEHLLEELTEWGCRRFGPHYDEQSGFGWYGQRREWAGGLKIGYGQKGTGGTCCVELVGSVLARFDAADRVEMLRELLELGCKVTRIDLALDVRSDRVDLVQRVGEACYTGRLCGARTWRPVVEFGAGGECAGQTVYIGKRGKDGSGRLVRVYDKGLETGDLPANQWHRMEVECTGEVAVQVGVGLAQSPDSPHFCAQVVIGAVSFREGDKGRAWSERPECAWWSQFRAAVQGVRYVAKRRLSSMAGRASWILRCVLPGLIAEARVSGQTVVGRVLEVVRQELPEGAVRRAMKSAAVVEYALFKGVPIHAVGFGKLAGGVRPGHSAGG